MEHDPELLSGALHEAGHACVLVHFKQTFQRVRLFPGVGLDGMRGCVDRSPNSLHARPPERTDPENAAALREIVRSLEPAAQRELRDRVIVEELFCYAGIACEDPRTVAWGINPQLFASSQNDRAGLRLMLGLLGWSRDSYCMKSLRRAQRFCDARWGSVRAVALTLLDRLASHGSVGELSGDEVRALIAGAPKESNPWRERMWWKRVEIEWIGEPPKPVSHA